MSQYSRELIATIMERDPAARSPLEVRLLYSGYKAVMSHRRAHWFYTRNMKFIARWISESSKRRTGIEIHPGAQIGKNLMIDHGVGVVIGETTVIGDNCTIYQCVTLGGTGKDTGKRHPTIGNNVLIGSGAKVLGPFTVGNNVKIAAGAVVLTEIPDDCTAVGVPAKIVRRGGKKEDMDQIHIPDPVTTELCKMRHQIELLEARIKELENTDTEKTNKETERN